MRCEVTNKRYNLLAMLKEVELEKKGAHRAVITLDRDQIRRMVTEQKNKKEADKKS